MVEDAYVLDSTSCQNLFLRATGNRADQWNRVAFNKRKRRNFEESTYLHEADARNASLG